jgi:hypothetical protein
MFVTERPGPNFVQLVQVIIVEFLVLDRNVLLIY